MTIHCRAVTNAFAAQVVFSENRRGGQEDGECRMCSRTLAATVLFLLNMQISRKKHVSVSSHYSRLY